MIRRQTPVKNKLQDIFKSAVRPVSAVECLEACLLCGLKPNKTTIYRELKKQVMAGEIEEIVMEDGIKRYESTKKQHGHCLVCEGCGQVERVELPNDLSQQESKIERSTRYRILRHDLTFYGRCPACKQN